MSMKDFWEDINYRIYSRGIRRLIPTYHDRTIFTRFFWRTLKDRTTKGFDETCTWSLNYSLAKLIAPRLEMFIKHKCGVPMFYVNEVKEELIKKGKPYDTKSLKFKNKKDQNRMYNEAEKRWDRDLGYMLEAFADIVEEEDNYDKWTKKYEARVNKHNKKLEKLTTIEEKKAYWDSIVSCRSYYPRTVVITEDLAGNIRRRGLELFAKYYGDLWW